MPSHSVNPRLYMRSHLQNAAGVPTYTGLRFTDARVPKKIGILFPWSRPII